LYRLGRENACRISMRGHVQAVRVFEEAVGVLVKVLRMAIEAVRMTLETMRILLEAVRVHVDSITGPEKSDFEASECLIRP
jgi:hypothetical protein